MRIPDPGDADERARLLAAISGAQSNGSEGIDALLKDQLPTYYRFWALLNYLPQQVALFENGGWPKVPTVKKLEPGKSDGAVPAIRRA